MTSPKKLSHVVLRTADLPAMRDWYVTVLGGRVTYENPLGAFISYDDEHHRIGLVNFGSTEAPSPQAWGLEHIAFTFESLTELLDTYQRLEAVGIAPVLCTNHGPTTSLYYRDPEGNQVELLIDNVSSLEEIETIMSSPEFQANPMGEPIDPETLLAGLRAGRSEAELTRPASLGV